MFTGPRIVRDNLLLHLDAANTKHMVKAISQNDITGTDHGISEWYCFGGGTATYSAVYPGTIIFSIDPTGVETEVVSKTLEPSRGTFSVVSGNRYYSTKPIHLMSMGNQHLLSPLSLKGNYFGHYSNRYGMSNFNIYCPSGSGTVYYYEDVIGGVSGTATSSTPINAGEQITITSISESKIMLLHSTVEVLVTANESNGSANDNVIVPPASTDVYFRRRTQFSTIQNTTPSTNNTNYSGDVEPLFTVEIADGSGGDASQGLGLEYLSDTYSFGEVLSDYKIIAPYPNTKIRVVYYENGWKLGEEHQLNGTQTVPDSAFRSGDLGFGVEADVAEDDGQSPHFANNNKLWKWEGNQPFALIINDSTADEDLLLGWMSEKSKRGYWPDLSGNDNYGLFKGRPTIVNDYLGGITFNGVDDYYDTGIDMDLPNNPNGFSVLCFIDNIGVGSRYLVCQTYTLGYSSNWILGYQNGGLWFRGATVDGGNIIGDGKPHSIAMTYDGTVAKLYIDGEYRGQVNGTKNPTVGTVKLMTRGDAESNFVSGNMNICRIYDRVLSDNEINRNHRANKSRFKI